MISDNLNRVVTLDEKIAYKNLESYDDGRYTPKKLVELTNKKTYNDFTNEESLTINEEILKEYVHYVQLLNSKHSNFNAGIFASKNEYEATFAKKVYYESELEFIIEVFISHHNVHAFMDGNKRTALNFLLELLYKYTKFYLNNILVIQDAQIYYLTEQINKDEFVQIILNEVRSKVVKGNTKCHLEHLIPRIELDDEAESSGFHQTTDRKANFSLTDLENGQFFYDQLKKPYFQRDTNEWTVERVEKLLNTFLEDGLIPAIILWETNDGDILIIDGAHRISSLIAWVNNDFGRVNVSSTNTHHEISDYFNSKIGNYEEIKRSKEEKYKNVKQIIAKKSVPIQWVTGDYEKVKESFIRINEQGVTLSNDEKELIQKDKLPTSKLARAILSHGTGQSSKNQTENSKTIFEYFFTPTLIRDNVFYPMFGAMDEDFVISKVFNVLKIIDESYDEDVDLSERVLEFARFSQDYLQISNKVYFYGANQHYKNSSLFGFSSFILELMRDNELLQKYLKHRGKFEDFLTENERFVQTISRKRRQSSKAVTDILMYYKTVLESISKKDEEIIYKKFSYLSKSQSEQTPRQKIIEGKYIEFLEKIPRCPICKGYIDGPNNIDEELIHECCK
ncbi:hypothetical protein M222_1558 [Enterococcus faecalis AZ19]|uniref:GmrSD restriction endonuclease domain-containing protein n=1 Tax=Enterococcus faecalis TaxID=1351 RepID=UPI00045A017D|nr:DUF262 domain-containing protein [Enterococcus faecalis]KAJ74309.1 hypothetical protein M222_1558 [Enterococcus faecalis AZ19]